MDFESLLAALEYKPLNVRSVQLLKSVYAVQDENIQLLKITNGALQESASLLRSRIQELVAEVAALRAVNEELRLKLPPEVEFAPSPTAWDILAEFEARDATQINATSDLSEVSQPRRSIESALEELCTAGVVEIAGLGDHGCWFKLTPYGSEFVARQPPSQRRQASDAAKLDGRRSRQGVR
jgi:hypothetical protein